MLFKTIYPKLLYKFKKKLKLWYKKEWQELLQKSEKIYQKKYKKRIKDKIKV